VDQILIQPEKALTNMVAFQWDVWYASGTTRANRAKGTDTARPTPLS